MIKDYLYKNYVGLIRLLKPKRPHYKTANEFWVQKMPVKKVSDRMDLFKRICKNKDVIHFGCTDWPIFNPENNLHIKLAKYAKSIDGFDLDKPGIENLRQYVDQEYFSDYESLPLKQYDICLIPETIEHVNNVEEFIRNVSKINANKFLITAPNCLSAARRANYHIDNDSFIEVVHPDHNSWFSPYTLKNVIEKFSDLKVEMTYLMHNETVVCCECSRLN